jgi:hypothetical protein
MVNLISTEKDFYKPEIKGLITLKAFNKVLPIIHVNKTV